MKNLYDVEYGKIIRDKEGENFPLRRGVRQGGHQFCSMLHWKKYLRTSIGNKMTLILMELIYQTSILSNMLERIRCVKHNIDWNGNSRERNTNSFGNDVWKLKEADARQRA